MNKYVVDVDLHTVTRVVVEAASPAEAEALVGEIGPRDLSALLLHESTVHDRHVCDFASLDYRRTNTVRLDVDPEWVGEL